MALALSVAVFAVTGVAACVVTVGDCGVVKLSTSPVVVPVAFEASAQK